MEKQLIINVDERVERAQSLFKAGYNCAQAVVMAFDDVMGLSPEELARLTAPFGGGMGRLREVCGSVSGMFMVFGFLKGYSDPSNYDEKKELYAHIQELGRRFEEENSSIVCRELLGLNTKHDSATPEKRTENYYKKRPCAELVGSATDILEQYLNEIA